MRVMSHEESPEAELRHQLGNAQQEKAALQHLLEQAADELEEIVEADCQDEAKDEALATAAKLRRAASL
jgi:hypothetical protein